MLRHCVVPNPYIIYKIENTQKILKKTLDIETRMCYNANYLCGGLFCYALRQPERSGGHAAAEREVHGLRASVNQINEIGGAEKYG